MKNGKVPVNFPITADPPTKNLPLTCHSPNLPQPSSDQSTAKPPVASQPLPVIKNQKSDFLASFSLQVCKYNKIICKSDNALGLS